MDLNIIWLAIYMGGSFNLARLIWPTLAECDKVKDIGFRAMAGFIIISCILLWPIHMVLYFLLITMDWLIKEEA